MPQALVTIAFFAMLVNFSCTEYSFRSAAVTTLLCFVYEVLLAATYDGSGVQIRVDLFFVLPLLVAAWAGAVATFLFGAPETRGPNTQ